MIVRVYANEGPEIFKATNAEVKYTPNEKLLIVVKGETLLFTGNSEKFFAISSSK